MSSLKLGDALAVADRKHKKVRLRAASQEFKGVCIEVVSRCCAVVTVMKVRPIYLVARSIFALMGHVDMVFAAETLLRYFIGLRANRYRD